MTDEKVQIIVEEYLNNGFNKKQALIASGYSRDSAQFQAYSVFRNPKVEAELKRRLERVKKKHELTEDWVVERLMRIANAPETIAKFKKVDEDGHLTWDFTDADQEDLAVIEGFSYDHYTEGRGKNSKKVKRFKIDKSDVKGALDSLGRRLGMFDDRVSVDVEMSLVERIQRGRERAYDMRVIEQAKEPASMRVIEQAKEPEICW